MDLAMHYLPEAKTQEQTFYLEEMEQPVTLGFRAWLWVPCFIHQTGTSYTFYVW